MYQLVALDLDGTLLSSQHELLFENRIVVDYLNKQGIRFVLVTGRPDQMAVTYANQLGIEPLILSYNGAVMRDVATQEIYASTFIKQSIIETICDELNHTGIYYRLYGLNSVYSFNSWEFDPTINPYAQFSHNLKQAMGFNILSSLDDLQDDIVKVVAFSEHTSELETIKLQLRHIKGIEIVFGSKNGLDINASGVNKGQALLQFGQINNILPANIIAMGDSENDLSMLCVVGMPITLENGAQEVKNQVKYITKSNDEAGVAYALKHFFKDLFKVSLEQHELLLVGPSYCIKQFKQQYTQQYHCLDLNETNIQLKNNQMIVVMEEDKETNIACLMNQGFIYMKDFILSTDLN